MAASRAVASVFSKSGRDTFNEIISRRDQSGLAELIDRDFAYVLPLIEATPWAIIQPLLSRRALKRIVKAMTAHRVQATPLLFHTPIVKTLYSIILAYISYSPSEMQEDPLSTAFIAARNISFSARVHNALQAPDGDDRAFTYIICKDIFYSEPEHLMAAEVRKQILQFSLKISHLSKRERAFLAWAYYQGWAVGKNFVTAVQLLREDQDDPIHLCLLGHMLKSKGKQWSDEGRGLLTAAKAKGSVMADCFLLLDSYESDPEETKAVASLDSLRTRAREGHPLASILLTTNQLGFNLYVSYRPRGRWSFGSAEEKMNFIADGVRRGDISAFWTLAWNCDQGRRVEDRRRAIDVLLLAQRNSMQRMLFSLQLDIGERVIDQVHDDYDSYVAYCNSFYSSPQDGSLAGFFFRYGTAYAGQEWLANGDMIKWRGKNGVTPKNIRMKKDLAWAAFYFYLGFKLRIGYSDMWATRLFKVLDMQAKQFQTGDWMNNIQRNLGKAASCYRQIEEMDGYKGETVRFYAEEDNSSLFRAEEGGKEGPMTIKDFRSCGVMGAMVRKKSPYNFHEEAKAGLQSLHSLICPTIRWGAALTPSEPNEFFIALYHIAIGLKKSALLSQLLAENESLFMRLVSREPAEAWERIKPLLAPADLITINNAIRIGSEEKVAARDASPSSSLSLCS